MRALALEIYGFRGIQHSRLIFSDNLVFIGPNGSGKSTIIDALSLIFGRQKLVRELTEHDFFESCPKPEDRFRIIVTLGGFTSNDPAAYPQWFRHDRAIEKWWNAKTKSVEPIRGVDADELCVQIGYAARFDHDDLVVEQKRFFHDDDTVVDPFMEDAVATFPLKLLNEVGFFVLPARRTWASTISFGSELFRRAVATMGGIPASSLLKHRDELRNPESCLEDDPAIKPLIISINKQLAQLMPTKPRLQLRVTSTDSESLLQALVPHFECEIGSSLPAGRHGTGLVSLQTLVLLLEIGRARREKSQSFILAMEEPELHVPPGLQRRLIGEAAGVADQVICTTHSPRVAAFFNPYEIQILARKRGNGDKEHPTVDVLEGRALTSSSMMGEQNALIQLFTDDRTRLVEALMFPYVFVPEGRIDAEWLRLLLDIVETGAKPLHPFPSSVPPFGSVIGVIPTRDSAVQVTLKKLRGLHSSVFALVDGDKAGDGYIKELLKCDPPPSGTMQWPSGWCMEDVIGWVIEADEELILPEIENRLDRQFGELRELVDTLKNSDGKTNGLKSHYVAHEEIAGAIKRSERCVHRAEIILETLTRAAVGLHEGFQHLNIDASHLSESVTVYRFNP